MNPVQVTTHELAKPRMYGLAPICFKVANDVFRPTAAIAVPNKGSEAVLPTPTTAVSHWDALSTPNATPQFVRVISPTDRATVIPANPSTNA
eukprot:CAMPEP_0118944432 /NCGR_PEP_ID=MMETSP1169-20130426/40296_1 /TAXON_ID=36882 /ORGANISM="Pyramimonas obovata, Strain CCMP722" /LENGTH=91 /DNA_ID=CAMNT_0006889919 /DNA_START=75 /DNA_END=347 /DNA_ORIENTATION=-